MPTSRTIASCACSGLRESALRSTLKQKKAVLLDQFGVLHDGRKLYPGAREAVEYLHKECGLRILIVSNSSRRSNGALMNLEKKGIDIESIEDVITSGEVTWAALSSAPREDVFKGLRRCVHFTWGARGAISLEGLEVEVVGRNVDDADFLLAHGTEAIGTMNGPSSCSLDDMKALLEKAAARGLPMVVANPDMVTVDGDELRVMPGTLAKYYEDLDGGVVYRMGKPDGRIYVQGLRMLGLEAGEVIAIGDSMEHDILGAASMAIDSIFIAGGIHKDTAMVGGGGSGAGEDVIHTAGVDQLCAKFGCRPTFVLPWFGV